MVKLRYPHNPQMWEGGDAAGITGYGVLRVVNDELFVDDGALLSTLSQFDGRKVMYEFVFPEQAEYEIDKDIRPLVEAMQSKGILTLGSCQGHLGLSEAGREQRKAYVGLYIGDLTQERSIPEGWEWEATSHRNVWRIVSKAEIKNEDDVQVMRDAIRKATEFYR